MFCSRCQGGYSLTIEPDVPIKDDVAQWFSYNRNQILTGGLQISLRCPKVASYHYLTPLLMFASKCVSVYSWIFSFLPPTVCRPYRHRVDSRLKFHNIILYIYIYIYIYICLLHSVRKKEDRSRHRGLNLGLVFFMSIIWTAQVVCFVVLLQPQQKRQTAGVGKKYNIT